MPDDLTVVSSEPLPDLSVVNSQPLPDAGPQGSALWRGAKAFGSDVLGAVKGLAEMVPGVRSIQDISQGDLPAALQHTLPGGDVLEKAQQAEDILKADAARKAAGYGPIYRGAAITGQTTGIINPTAMEEAAAKGDTASIVGHTILPLAGAALGADEALTGGKGVGGVKEAANSLKEAAQVKAASVVRDPITGKVRSPYETVIDKLVPDPYATNAIPAKTVPKGTNYGQYLSEQKAAARARAKVEASPIVTPATTAIESEGRPATWTNEKVLSMAGTGDVRAIQQARLRALDLPPNAALVSNRAATITPSVGTPRSTTLFDASGHPIGGEPEIELMNTEGSRTNASGESGASMEAINRSHSERLAGTKRIRIDTRSGNETPLLGADAVDAKPGPYDEIITRDKNGNETTLDRGGKARPRRTVQ